MTAIEFLIHRGPHRAVDIANALGRPVEAVYGDLIVGEGVGLVRQRVTHPRGSMPVVEWMWVGDWP